MRDKKTIQNEKNLNKDNFYIKKGYEIFDNSLNNTIDENRESKYQNKYRINKSASYQYDVYKFPSSLVSGKKDKVVDIGCGPATKLVKIIGKKTKNIIGLDQDSAIQFCKNNINLVLFIKQIQNPQAITLTRFKTQI